MPVLLPQSTANFTDAALRCLWDHTPDLKVSLPAFLATINSAVDFVRTHLLNITWLSVTLPSIDQYVVHRIKLDNFAVEDIALPALVACAALASLVFSCIFDWRLQSYKRIAVHTSQPCSPLYALMTVIAPAFSRWPAYYLSVAEHGLARGDSRLQLSLRQLQDDVICGAIELRSPEHDLPSLILDTLKTQEWDINLVVEPSWHFGLAVRTTGLRLASILPQGNIKLPTLGPPGIPSKTASSESALKPALGESYVRPDLTFQLPRSSQGRPVLMLDAVPYHALQAYIRAFQSSLIAGTSVMIGFSTLGSATQSNRQRVLASIPFMNRSYTKRGKQSGWASDPSLSARRTLTPLLTTLNQVLELVSSGPSSLTVDSVQNVSEQYTGHLQDYVQDLTDLPNIRDKFVAQWGMEGWREERFLGSWEAALFSTGILTRWLVLVRN